MSSETKNPHKSPLPFHILILRNTITVYYRKEKTGADIQLTRMTIEKHKHTVTENSTSAQVALIHK